MKKLFYTLALVLLATAAYFYYQRHNPMLWSANKGQEPVYVFIKDGDTQQDVKKKLSRVCYGDPKLFDQLCEDGYEVIPGRYAISPGMTWPDIYEKVKSGIQDPVTVVVPTEREIDKWCQRATANLALSNKELYALLCDSNYTRRYGFTPATITAMIIPGSYEMFWDCTIDEFMDTLKEAYDTFWDGKRESECRNIGFSRLEVITIASIVDQETNYQPEKSRMAGVYINRLRQGMLLQSCPTAIYANKAWGVNRVTKAMTRIDNPYNTYRYKGLPPGPICIAKTETIDAVLHYEHNDFLYFAAKADFSGQHNFAKTFQEHEANGKEYIKAFEEQQKRKAEKEKAEAELKIEN